MAQKPVDQRHKLNTRAALWTVMRELGHFTASELAKHTLYHVSTVKDYLQGLAAAGYLSLDPGAKPPTYIFDQYKCPFDPPRVRKDGSAVTQGQGRKNLWRTAKILGEFSVLELVEHAKTDTVRISDKEAADYVYHLHKAGYLTIVQASSPAGRRARYRFNMSRNTGPLPPQVQRVKRVYDSNTKSVVWTGGADGK